MTTPSRLAGSGPNIEANTPSKPVPPSTCDRLVMAVMKPPLSASTAAMTAMMPMSMMMPWRKSFTTVAM